MEEQPRIQRGESRTGKLGRQERRAHNLVPVTIPIVAIIFTPDHCPAGKLEPVDLSLIAPFPDLTIALKGIGQANFLVAEQRIDRITLGYAFEGFNGFRSNNMHACAIGFELPIQILDRLPDETPMTHRVVKIVYQHWLNQVYQQYR